MKDKTQTESSHRVRTTPGADTHLLNLFEHLKVCISELAKKQAGLDTNVRPIEIRTQDFDDAYYFFVKNPPKIRGYRWIKALLIIFSGFGFKLIISNPFDSIPTLLSAVFGVVLIMFCVLAEIFILDKRKN